MLAFRSVNQNYNAALVNCLSPVLFIRLDILFQYAHVMSLAVCDSKRQRYVNKFAQHALPFMNWNET